MIADELRKTILQLAMQGRLVEQRPEEGTGEELYQQLQKDKLALIKTGMIKKEKPQPEIAEVEKPFDIPKTWKWLRFGEVSQLLDGEKKSNMSYPILDVKFLRGKSSPTYITEGKFVSKGAKIILVDGENSGEVFIVPEDGYSGSTFKILDFSKALCEKYVLFYLLFHKSDYRNNKRGAAIPHLDKNLFFGTLFPLPPLAEQKRIVTKIEELFPLIDRYEKVKAELALLGDDTKKSLLQMAIQGKLVEQRPEEGTGEELYQQIQKEKARLIKEGKIKKEKPLAPISEDEIPFEIPESWKWVRWGDIVNVVSARRVHQNDWKSSGIPFYRAREIAKLADNGFVDNELFISQELYNDFSKSGVPHPGDLMVTAVGTLGKTYIVQKEDCFYYKDASVICLENFAGLCPEFLKYLMQSNLMIGQVKSNSDGTTVATLTMVRMIEYKVPLPPLAEQKRIVARLEELLPLCEKLKGNR